MLKRIAVLNNPEMLDTLSLAARDRNVEVIGLAPGNPLPAATSAVVAAPHDSVATLDAALALGNWNEQLLILLAQAIDCREEFDPDSSRRVWQHAVCFARALNLSPAEQLTFERAALVRDIGKLQIPNDTLLKDAILNYDEWELIRQHPSRGADMVERMDVLADTADIVRYHHESIDGGGYPEGLAGDKIPLLARAMRIVDVYCAMTSRRRYREGLSSSEEAIAHLEEDSGSRFDPELVRIFIEAGVASSAEDDM